VFPGSQTLFACFHLNSFWTASVAPVTMTLHLSVLSITLALGRRKGGSL
jgi:hypothetical protein